MADLRLPVATPRALVTIFLGDEPVEAHEGEPVAVALWAAGRRVLRYSADRAMPRGLFCAAGVCQECLMVIDGQPNVRACLTPVRDGMRIALPDSRVDESGQGGP